MCVEVAGAMHPAERGSNIYRPARGEYQTQNVAVKSNIVWKLAIGACVIALCLGTTIILAALDFVQSWRRDIDNQQR